MGGPELFYQLSINKMLTENKKPPDFGGLFIRSIINR